MLHVLGLILRVFCFVFHLTLGVFVFTLAVIALRTQTPALLDALPFSFDVLPRNALILGLAGIVFTLQALTKHFKFVFFLWAVTVLFLATRWLPIGWLTWGAFLSVFGAGWAVGARRGLPIF